MAATAGLRRPPVHGGAQPRPPAVRPGQGRPRPSTSWPTADALPADVERVDVPMRVRPGAPRGGAPRRGRVAPHRGRRRGTRPPPGPGGRRGHPRADPPEPAAPATTRPQGPTRAPPPEAFARTGRDGLADPGRPAGAGGRPRPRAAARGSVAQRAADLAGGPADDAGVGAQATMLAAEAFARSGHVRRGRATGSPRIGGPARPVVHRRGCISRSPARRSPPRRATRRGRAASCAGRRAASPTSRPATPAWTTGPPSRCTGVGSRRSTSTWPSPSGTPRRSSPRPSGGAGVSHRLPPVSPSGDATLDDLLARLRQAAHRAPRRGRSTDAEVAREVLRLERAVAHRDWETARPRTSGASGGGADRRPPSATPAARRARRAGAASSRFFVHAGRLRAVTIEADRAVVLDLADRGRGRRAGPPGARPTSRRSAGWACPPCARPSTARSPRRMARLDDRPRARPYPAASRAASSSCRPGCSRRCPGGSCPGSRADRSSSSPSATFWAGGPGLPPATARPRT